jgi:hypothetical protein
MRLAELLSREVGAADLAHLAGLRELIQPPERVRDRYLRIGLMEVGEIDALGLQPAQAVLEHAPHVIGPCATPPLVHGHAELAG